MWQNYLIIRRRSLEKLSSSPLPVVHQGKISTWFQAELLVLWRLRDPLGALAVWGGARHRRGHRQLRHDLLPGLQEPPGIWAPAHAPLAPVAKLELECDVRNTLERLQVHRFPRSAAPVLQLHQGWWWRCSLRSQWRPAGDLASSTRDPGLSLGP